MRRPIGKADVDLLKNKGNLNESGCCGNGRKARQVGNVKWMVLERR